MLKYKLGLVSVSFRDKTPEEILAAMKCAGLCCVEWGSDIHAPCDDTDRLREILKLQKQYGIECCSYGTYFRLGETDIVELQKYIAAAKMLGTNILRLWCGIKGSQEYSDTEKAELFDICKSAVEIAAKNAVVLCMECHNNTYTDTLDGVKELMTTVNHPNFKMYWQPNQFKSEEENIRYAEWVAPHCTNVHVFNWEGDKHLELADAVDIWKIYLEKIGSARNLLLEFMPDDRIESLSRESDALRMIVEGM